MLVKTFGAAMQGIDAIIITVEVAVERGYMYSIVGLPDTAVKESQERVRLALLNSGRELPRHHVVINLSPADVRKEGAAYDLPIAVAVMAGAEKIKAPELDKYMIMGELSLDGSVLPIRGALPMSILARSLGFEGMIVPAQNAPEAAVVNNLDVYGVKSLAEVVDLLSGTSSLEPTVVDTRAEFMAEAGRFPYDFSEVKGQ